MGLSKDKKYMELAIEQANKAFVQGEFPVGCVIMFNDIVVASGSRVGTASKEKYLSEIYHAEIRALQAFESSIADRIKYNSDTTAIFNDIGKISYSKIVPEQCTIYCTMEPCLMCFGAIIISGIKKIVYAFEDTMGGGTSCDLKSLPPIYRDSGIIVVPNVLRDKSLELFARFFLKKDNLYWKNSILERYTLAEMAKFNV